MKPNSSPDAIDAAATAAAQKYRDGELDEQDALWQCAVLFMESRMSRPIAAKQTYTLGVDAAEEIESMLDELVITKIVKRVDGGSYLDLERIAAGESLMGWARNLLRAAAPSERRNYQRRNRAQPTDDVVLHSHTENMSSHTGDIVQDDKVEELHTTLVLRSWGVRDQFKSHEHARAATKFLGVGTVPRTPPEQRQAVLDVLASRSEAAHRSLTQIVASPSQRHPHSDDDDLFADIWNSYSPGDQHIIADADPRFAAILAAASATPVPTLSRSCTELMRDICIERCRDEYDALRLGHKSGSITSQRFMAHLVRSYVKATSDAKSTNRSDRIVLWTDQERATNQDRYQQAVLELLELGITSLGTTPREVTASLDVIRDMAETELAVGRSVLAG